MINPMSRTDGGPAFATDPDPKAWEGMSLRDWFAGMALTGLIMVPALRTLESNVDLAYKYANAMLKARRSGNGPSDKV